MIELPINPQTGNRMLVMRQSDFNGWLTDQRDVYLSVFENLAKPRFKTGSADIGTFVHAGLKAYYEGTDPVASIAAEVTKEVLKAPAFTLALMEHGRFADLIVQGYIEWAEAEAVDHGLTNLAVEKRVIALVGVFFGIEVYMSGAIDRLMKDEEGQVWVLDHKTVDKFTDITKTLPVNFQGRSYDFLCRSIGIVPVGFIHNQLKRSKRTAAATPPFYMRQDVPYNEHSRRTHDWHMQGIAHQIAERWTIMEQFEFGTPEWEHAFHFYFPPNFTKDSSWRSDFLDASINFDLDPAAAFDMLTADYIQKQPLLEDDTNELKASAQ